MKKPILFFTFVMFQFYSVANAHTISDILSDFQSGKPITIAIIGDSTSMGYGANPGPNKWTDNSFPSALGISYAYTNYPDAGPNWNPDDQFVIKTIANPNGRIEPATQANTSIPSSIRKLETWIKSKNIESVIYNFSGSGWTANDHISHKSILLLAALKPKPDIVLIVTGINSAKNSQSQTESVDELINQSFDSDIHPVLVKENNVGVDKETGTWFGPEIPANSFYSSPKNWVKMPYWSVTRKELDNLSIEHSLEIIDLGTADGAIDVTKLYDPFHPNASGYDDIFKKYKVWFSDKTLSSWTRTPIRNLQCFIIRLVDKVCKALKLNV